MRVLVDAEREAAAGLVDMEVSSGLMARWVGNAEVGVAEAALVEVQVVFLEEGMAAVGSVVVVVVEAMAVGSVVAVVVEAMATVMEAKQVVGRRGTAEDKTAVPEAVMAGAVMVEMAVVEAMVVVEPVAVVAVVVEVKEAVVMVKVAAELAVAVRVVAVTATAGVMGC